ncbi:MAG: LAGLIDADG family homing endonuclease, partial [Candidatus Nanoarchaeia archaeon]
TKEVYGMVVMDRRDAMFALLKGKKIVPLTKTHSEVPGKFKAGGQCLAPNTMVQSADGNIFNIHWTHNPHRLKSADFNKGTIMDSPVTDKWDVKKKNIYRVTTKHPRLQVEASEDHVFFVVTKEGMQEKSAKELRVNDKLVMPEQIRVKGEIQQLNPEGFYNSYIITQKGARQLKEARLRKGLKQRELAEIISVTQTTISSYEIGKLNIDNDQLKKLCSALDIAHHNFVKHFAEPYSNLKLPTNLTVDLARIIGYFIGDGSFENERISFTEQREHVAREYTDIISKTFKTNTRLKKRENKGCWQIRCYGKPIVRFFRTVFPEIKKTKDTLIPQKILCSQDDVVAAFLRGIFDAEGYATNRCVALGIHNKQLVHQLQMLLLRFSIISSIHEYDNRRNPYSTEIRFTLDITERQSLELFQKHIRFTSDDKQEKLKATINGKTNKSNVRQMLAPGSHVRKIIEQAGYNLQLFPKTSGFFNDKREINKNTFKESILNCVEDKKLHKQLKSLFDLPLLPVKITSIQVDQKETSMVDISVANQNFIANGLLVHNSAQRFARLREGAIKEHYKKIAAYMKDQFFSIKQDLKGILIGGPSTTTNDFMNKGYVTGDLQKKIIAVRDLSYTGEFGLQELLERSQDVLAAEEVAEEKAVIQEFLLRLAKEPGKVTYGDKETRKAIDMGAVQTLLLSEDLDDATIEELEGKAEDLGSTTIVISTETREGVQLKDFGKVAALLRYDISAMQ